MTPEALATLHGRAFAGQGRGWSAEEFAGLLDTAHVYLVEAAGCFALGRALAGEAELLTLAVDPARQRAGHGARLLNAFEDEAVARGASRAFLEVSELNAAALSLYTRAEYHEVARRADYYQSPDGRTADALILAKDLP